VAFKVSVFGLGYVGLVISAVSAAKFNIIGVDKDSNKISRLNKGQSVLFEPDLDKIILSSRTNLRFTSNSKDALNETNLTIIAVGTPFSMDGSQDLSAVIQVAYEIGNTLKPKDDRVIVIKSTVLPGTTEGKIIPLIEKASNLKHGRDFHVCVNPEFLREGSAIDDMLNPDKIVIGSNDSYALESLKTFYNILYEGREIPLVTTNFTNAETIKFAQNAFLATKISFINTISQICERVPEADVEVVAKAIGLDKRISPHFLRAGLGYGGGCLPKDLNTFRNFSRGRGYDPVLLDAVMEVNNLQPQRVIEIAEDTLGDLKGKIFSILGLSFKPNTNDIREAPSIKIIESLLTNEAVVKVYDPKSMPGMKRLFGDRITYCENSSDCLDSSDCCIIVTEWEEFRDLKQSKMIELMKYPLIIDGRRVLHKEELSDTDYHAIGLAERDNG
jgi:UDPglucose 6-dehydrogenase